MNVSTTFHWCGHAISTTMFNSDRLHKHWRRNTEHMRMPNYNPPMSVRPPHDQTKLTVNNHVTQTQPKMTTFVVFPNNNTRTDGFFWATQSIQTLSTSTQKRCNYGSNRMQKSKKSSHLFPMHSGNRCCIFLLNVK